MLVTVLLRSVFNLSYKCNNYVLWFIHYAFHFTSVILVVLETDTE